LEATNWEAVVWKGGEKEPDTVFIGWLEIVGMLRIEYYIICQVMREWLGAGNS